MRISDWSSDVCSSDLTRIGQSGTNLGSRDVVNGAIPSLDNSYSINLPAAAGAPSIGWSILGSDFQIDLELQALQTEGRGEVISSPRVVTRSEERRVGKECVSTSRSRWSPSH